MRIIYRGRQTGRTNELIQLAAEAITNGELVYIVCATRDRAQMIARKAEELNLQIQYPPDYDEFLSKQWFSRHIDRFYIDDVEHLIQYLGNGKVAAITLEKQEDELDY